MSPIFIVIVAMLALAAALLTSFILFCRMRRRRKRVPSVGDVLEKVYWSSAVTTFVFLIFISVMAFDDGTMQIAKFGKILALCGAYFILVAVMNFMGGIQGRDACHDRIRIENGG